MPEPFVLPELARSLRAFGTGGDAASEAVQGAIFGPLLDARARAAASDVDATLAVFRGEALAARISVRVAEVAQAGIEDAAYARARSARARDLIDPLRAELRALDLLALDLLAPAAGKGEWQAWVEQLRRVFTAADASCSAVARLLRETEPPPIEARRRWFGLRR